MLASICQVLFAAALCVLRNKSCAPLRLTPLIVGVISCVLLYYLGWVLYYFGFAAPPVILLLTLPPCCAFLLFALDRKNAPALIPAVVFALCHLFYAVVNFIL